MSQAQIAASIREGIDLQRKTLNLMVPSIATVAALLSDPLKRGNKILLMGNGGSAAALTYCVIKTQLQWRELLGTGLCCIDSWL